VDIYRAVQWHSAQLPKLVLFCPKLALPDPWLLGALFRHVLTPFFHCICIINLLPYYYIAVLFTVAIHEPTKSRKPSQPLQFICVNGFGLVMPTSGLTTLQYIHSLCCCLLFSCRPALIPLTWHVLTWQVSSCVILFSPYKKCSHKIKCNYIEASGGSCLHSRTSALA